MLSIVRASIRNAVADRKGVTALEYAVIAAGVITAVVAATAILNEKLSAKFTALFTGF